MILLASQSPRRRELLAQIGCPFEVLVSDAPEVMGDSYRPEALVLENARRKALAAAKVREDLPVLGADTVVVKDGHIYGKPKDEADARRMLGCFAGGTHEVLTGIALVYRGKVWQDVAVTRVFFGAMCDAEIARCVICLARGEWPSREEDVEEVDVDKLKQMVHVKDEDIARLDDFVKPEGAAR